MNIDLDRNKLFRSSSETQHNTNSEGIVVRVTICLIPCDQCTGVYTDNLRGDILRVICHHQCHSKRNTNYEELESNLR